MEFIFKLKSQPVLIVVSRPSAGPGKSDVIIRRHNPVNGDIIVLCKPAQASDAFLHLPAGQAPSADDKFADLETQFWQFPQFLGL